MSQIATVFCYNGHEYEFDVRDAETAEKFEASVSRIQTADKNMPKDGKASSQIKYQCGIIKRFFDDCFEDGAGTDICGDRDNFGICMDAYNAFLMLVKEQKTDIMRMSGAFNQHSNRQQRRHQQHGNHNNGAKPKAPGK